MARVLLSYFSDYGEAMYDAICSILRQNGNDIFRFNINCSHVDRTWWGGECKINDKNLLEQIKTFSPEIIFNFNHSLPINAYEELSDSCKIYIIDADNPETFWNKDWLTRNSDRYIFLGLQSYSKTMYEKFLGKSLEDNVNYVFFPPATIVKNEKLEQDKNISFIGSNFYPLGVPQEENFYSKDAIKLYDAFKQDYYFARDDIKNISNNYEQLQSIYAKIKSYYVGQDRLKYMQVLTDLGFTFYGVRYWNRIAFYDFDLAKCFDPTPKTSIEDNQWVYNTSKISINISHPQAKSSFSWRVMDIMASNACLLMEDKPDWRELFEKYLSKETLEAIIYTDRYDMREKAIRLLTDENLRARCVSDLNTAIEKNGRWEQRFAILEKISNIPMISLPQKNQIDIFIKRSESVSHRHEKSEPIILKDKESKRNIIDNLKIYNRIKIFAYSICLALAQIPVIDLLFRKNKRKSLLHKIEKYWR